MAKVLSVAQKTFVDLYDSYVLDMSSDVIAVPCDQYGNILKQFDFTITYNASVGTKQVGSKYLNIIHPTNTVDDLYKQYNINIVYNKDNKITFRFYKGKTFDDGFKIGFKIQTTDNNQFVFERYITLIKVQNGEKATTFKIYSENGDTFKEGVEQIIMRTAAYDGLTQITNASYAWSYYSGSKWVSITEDQGDGNTIGSSLTIEKEDKYSSSVFRCIMTYNKKQYTDYFTLKIFKHQYDLVVKFFEGSNIFDSDTPYLAAYFELYKDQKLIDGLKATKFYYHTNNTYTESTDKYTFSSSGIDESEKYDGNLMYVIYKVSNPVERGAKYTARLCIYDESANTPGWRRVTSSHKNQYVYKNSLYDNIYADKTYKDIATNILVISKEDVPKSKDIDFTVFMPVKDESGNYVVDDLDLIVARNSVTVIDLNDPVISTTAPTNPKEGQLWLNTSSSPYMLYIYQKDTWVYFTQQNGKTVYTSKPTSYSTGDLWILAPGETCGNFGEGTMLRAKQSSSTWNASHWEDAMSAFTEMYQNIEQTFTFNKYNYIYDGKRPGVTIGQTNNAFYVNINSERMSFFDNSDGKDKEVVYISNESANIDGLVVETSLDVNCNAAFDGQVKFGNFKWKVETNGSLSLGI